MLGGTEFEYCRIFVSRKMEGFTGSDDVLEILDRLQRADLEIKRDVKKLHEMEKHNQEQEVLILQKTQILLELETSLQAAKVRLNTLKAKDKLNCKQVQWSSEFQARMKKEVESHRRELHQMDLDLAKEKNSRRDILNKIKKGFKI